MGVFPKFGVTIIVSITTTSSLGISWSTQSSEVFSNFLKFIYSLTLDCILFQTSTVFFTLEVTYVQFTGVPGVFEHITFAKLDI